MIVLQAEYVPSGVALLNSSCRYVALQVHSASPTLAIPDASVFGGDLLGRAERCHWDGLGTASA